jgi:hypothetical protein
MYDVGYFFLVEVSHVLKIVFEIGYDRVYEGSLDVSGHREKKKNK